MQFEEFDAYRQVEGALSPDESLIFEGGEDGVCIVNGSFPIPLKATSTLYPRNEILEIIDERGVRIGDLLTCKDEEYASVSAFSNLYLAAYLFEVPKDRYGMPGRFECDYLLIDKDRLREYRLDFLDSSAIWGGFQHLQGPIKTAPSILTPYQIIAKKDIKLPTPMHMEAASRSVSQPQAFERFLKLYHILELSFDLEIVHRINRLGADLNGIGEILSNYSAKEFNRLSQIIGRSTNPPIIAQCLNQLCLDAQWYPKIQRIFFDYGKESNPLDMKGEEFIRAIAATGFTLQTTIDLGVIKRSNSNTDQQKRFEALAKKLAAYWIYRVRCSIAHNRIGEYVMTSSDEHFVAFFAEPLLRCVLETTLF